MATKKYSAPPRLDYDPITGVHQNLSFGVVQSGNAANGINSAEGTAFRRLFPILKPDDPSLPWDRPTCFKHDVLLPSGASDEYWEAQALTRAYDQQGFSLTDLVVVITLRFPEVEASPPLLRLHEAWETARQFTLERLVRQFGVAAICILHVPARAARPGAPHVHVLVPARELLPSGFGMFAKPLASDDGRQILDEQWSSWLEAKGN